MIAAFLSFVLLAFAGGGQSAAAPVERLADGIRVPTADGFLSLHVKSDAIVRVTFARTAEFRADDMVVIGPAPAAAVRWSWSSTPQAASLTTSRLRVTVSRADGAVTFADASGRAIL